MSLFATGFPRLDRVLALDAHDPAFVLVRADAASGARDLFEQVCVRARCPTLCARLLVYTRADAALLVAPWLRLGTPDAHVTDDIEDVLEEAARGGVRLLVVESDGPLAALDTTRLRDDAYANGRITILVQTVPSAAVPDARLLDTHAGALCDVLIVVVATATGERLVAGTKYRGADPSAAWIVPAGPAGWDAP